MQSESQFLVSYRKFRIQNGSTQNDLLYLSYRGFLCPFQCLVHTELHLSAAGLLAQFSCGWENCVMRRSSNATAAARTFVFLPAHVEMEMERKSPGFHRALLHCDFLTLPSAVCGTYVRPSSGCPDLGPGGDLLTHQECIQAHRGHTRSELL